ncbi:hypothetical protein Pan44_51780 [Caulifigura coniformis]|uniref:Uncharacterized protein n=1 Tax=Caulifigura coniformis TaxID=2527983 RepID=A0A517SLW3_9PLAN|nr:hypothetical protein [Caulifigura coniformis]QDT57112.1 hypothetical protein Pan44_51780 [Caulifigura coniformis]
MRLEERMYSETDTQKVIECALHSGWHLDKAHAMYELALRALKDHSLLGVAWNCIGNEIVVATRQGPPLGQPAAAALLDAGQGEVERALAGVMQNWSIEQQRDLFLGSVEKSERYGLVSRLISSFGFTPKVEINKDGSIN